MPTTTSSSARRTRFSYFLIFHELINGHDGKTAAPVAYMLDQAHVIEPKIEAMVLSVLNVQTAYAKALAG